MPCRALCAVLAALSLCLLIGPPALAQTTTPSATQTPAQRSVSLLDVVSATLQNNAEVRTAQANLAQATAANTAAQADPSVLVAAKLNASQALGLAQAQERAARLGALQNTVNAFLDVLEGQQNVEVQALQVQADQRAVQVAQAKQQVGNATTLDVQNAGTTLAASQQNLADARAQLSLAQARLTTLAGLNATVQVTSPTLPTLNRTLAQLQGTLPRLSTLVSTSNAVRAAELTVNLANNDYTPARVLQDARTALANAQRSQVSAQQTAEQQLASAYQAMQNAAELLAVAASREDAAQKTYTQDTARLQSGTISAVDLQASQLNLKKAQYARLQAQGNALKALAALSVASSQNLTGVGGTFE